MSALQELTTPPPLDVGGLTLSNPCGVWRGSALSFFNPCRRVYLANPRVVRILKLTTIPVQVSELANEKSVSYWMWVLVFHPPKAALPLQGRQPEATSMMVDGKLLPLTS